jgi:hypothetical protein
LRFAGFCHGYLPSHSAQSQLSFMRARCPWIAALLLVGAANVHAYPPEYGPFEVGQAPTKSCVRRWECVGKEPSRWILAPTSNSTLDAIVINEVSGKEAIRYALTITNGGRQVFRYVMPDVGPTGWASEAYSGLINDDKVPDYVLVSGGTGCGILGWHHKFKIQIGNVQNSDGVRVWAIGVFFFCICFGFRIWLKDDHQSHYCTDP